MTTVYEVARAAHAAGICVLPPKQDGSKAPDAFSWTEYQRRLPTEGELNHWYGDPRRAGIGYVCGRISGGLELLDFDDHASAWDAFAALVEDNGLGVLWRRITNGYRERTPAGGYHVLFRSPHPSGAIKLAQRPKRPEEKEHERDNWQALIETKGEGGYVIAAPTNGAVHPSGGRYELLNGGVDSIATLTADERDALLALARMLDQKPRPVYGAKPSAAGSSAQGDKPGSRYNAATTWDDVLPAYGWRIDHRRGVTTYWTRAGKDQGVSATTNYQGNDLLWPFTSSTDLDPDRSYDRFGFYAVMEHGGDFREAARALARQGYGAKPEARNGPDSRESGPSEAPSGDAGDASDTSDDADEQESPRRRPSQATALVNLALGSGAELFHDPTGEPFATFTSNGHRETAHLSTKGFRQWLSKRYYDREGSAAGAQALQDALTVLAGHALYQGETHQVWCRLARHDGELWLDLGDDSWRAVRITAAGWSVAASAQVSVKFRRPASLLPLAEPDTGGCLTELRGFLARGGDGVRDDEQRMTLMIGWLIGAFQTDGGRAILELLGEQGSGKTMTARMLRRIVDANAVPLRTMPRDERDLVIQASNGLIVAYDNAGALKDWQSDAFCRLSTGGGIGGRRLYTDFDEVTLDAQRPCLITGINSVATRSDLLDRTTSVTLPAIPAQDRRSEALIWREFEAACPRLLGGLLTAVSTALANRDTVNLPLKPRLADYVEFVEAAAPALGWKAGAFARAFAANRRSVDDIAIESLPIGPAIIAYMQHRAEFEGSSSALLHELGQAVDDETRRDRDWPKRGNRLSNQLRQLAPNLRRLGISVSWTRSGQSGRAITMTKNQEVWDRHRRHDRHQDGDDSHNDAETGASGASSPSSPPSSLDRHPNGGSSPDPDYEPTDWWENSGIGDDGDEGDDSLPAYSEWSMDAGEAGFDRWTT